MSLATALCAYCEQLSENAPSHAVRVMRCPLCKTELGVTASGAKFRLVEGPAADPHPHSHRHAILVSAVVAALLLGALIVALVMLLRARTPEMPPTPNVADIVTPRPVSPRSTAEAIPVDVETLTQPAPQPEGAQVKPYLSRGNPGQRKPAPYPAKQLAQLPQTETTSRAPLPSLGSVLSDTGLSKTLLAQLDSVPEIALLAPPSKNLSTEDARKGIADQMRVMRDHNRNAEDGFVRHLMKERSDLAGLPFLLGGSCRLDAQMTNLFRQASITVRRAAAAPRSSQTAYVSAAPGPIANRFWYDWTVRHGESSKTPTKRQSCGIAALVQILGDADRDQRNYLVDLLANIDQADATKALVRYALYDSDCTIRREATYALHKRPVSETLPPLLRGFRHPWPAAAQHAGQALVEMHLTEAVPGLIEFLDEPDPAAPVALEVNGKKSLAVREMVRINHLRNCQLCHAPGDDRAVLQVRVPSPAEPAPPSFSLEYYGSEESRDIVVRADVTYLRQDFSLMQKVANADPWPDKQRFDFLVRNKPISQEEAAQLQKVNGRSLQHEFALATLRQLTGQDHGNSAADWRRAFVVEQAQKSASKR
jgi:HEAT repeats